MTVNVESLLTTVTRLDTSAAGSSSDAEPGFDDALRSACVQTTPPPASAPPKPRDRETPPTGDSQAKKSEQDSATSPSQDKAQGGDQPASSPSRDTEATDATDKPVASEDDSPPDATASIDAATAAAALEVVAAAPLIAKPAVVEAPKSDAKVENEIAAGLDVEAPSADQPRTTATKKSAVVKPNTAVVATVAQVPDKPASKPEVITVATTDTAKSDDAPEIKAAASPAEQVLAAVAEEPVDKSTREPGKSPATQPVVQAGVEAARSPSAVVAAVPAPAEVALVAATASAADSKTTKSNTTDNDSTRIDAATPAPPASEPATTASAPLKVTVGPRSEPDGTSTPTVDRGRFVERVARAFQAGAANSPIRLRLSPPELGALKIELRIDQGQMTAHVEAETQTARSLLLDHLPALRDRLAQHDIRIERFDVDVADRQLGGSPQQPHDGGQSRNARPSFHRDGTAKQAAAVEPTTTTTSSAATSGRLNVLI